MVEHLPKTAQGPEFKPQYLKERRKEGKKTRNAN
jgi:hypothetical protein